jgi:penicillin-binding protein 1B
MRVWAALMSQLGVSPLEARPPIGVELQFIDPQTGLLGEGCREARQIPFIAGSAPKASAACARGNSMLDEGLQWLQNIFH